MLIMISARLFTASYFNLRAKKKKENARAEGLVKRPDFRLNLLQMCLYLLTLSLPSSAAAPPGKIFSTLTSGCVLEPFPPEILMPRQINE